MLLPLLAGAWFAGFAGVAAFGAPWWLPPLWFAALAPGAWFGRGRQAGVAFAAAAVLAGAGAAYLEASLPGEPELAAQARRSLTLEGVVTSEPRPGRTSVTYEFQAEHLLTGTTRQPVSGGVLLVVGQ